MKETQKTDLEGPIDFGTIATLFGVSTAGVLFVAFYGAWSFGRGLFLSLGFPPSAFSLKGALDFFPEVGIGYAGAFCFTLILGFLIPIANKRLHFFVYLIVGILLLIDFLTVLNVRSIFYRATVLCAALFGPMVVGLIYRSRIKRPVKLGTMLLTVVTVLSIYSFHLYQFGEEEAKNITSLRKSLISDRGMAASKLEEYPIVTIVAKERLFFHTTPEEKEGFFIYAPTENSFVRIIFSDADRLYLIERFGSDTTSVSLSKAKVMQLVYHQLD